MLRNSGSLYHTMHHSTIKVCSNWSVTTPCGKHCFCRIYPKYRNANTCIVTNAAEIGNLNQLCSLIRICTISYLANDIGKAIIIIMFKLKNKNDNHLYSDIAMVIYFNFRRLSPILWSDCSRKIPFYFFFTLNLFTFTVVIYHGEAFFNNSHTI